MNQEKTTERHAQEKYIRYNIAMTKTAGKERGVPGVTHLAIFTSCGTSLLTNTSPNDRDLLNNYANMTEKEVETDSQIKDQLSCLIEFAAEKLKAADKAEARKLSAEINTLSRLENQGKPYDLSPKNWTHYLLHSDTYLGKKMADCIKEWLRLQEYCDVQVVPIKDLRIDKDCFRQGLGNLARVCVETMQPYQNDPTTHVVCNVTGGFKVLESFLQIAAMLYADESVYTFQGVDELIRVPRLPVELNLEKAVPTDKAKMALRQLKRRDTASINEFDLEGLADLAYEVVDNIVSITPWGEFLFAPLKEEYSKNLLDPISQRLELMESFKNDCKAIDANTKRLVNEAIDRLSSAIDDCKGDLSQLSNLNSLDMKQCKVKTGTLWEFDIGASGKPYRGFGVPASGGRFIVEHLGEHADRHISEWAASHR